MSPAVRYAVTGTAIVAAVLLGLWPILDGPSWRGVLWAAAIAVPVQALAFGLLQRFHGELNRFLAVWVGGTLARMVVVALVAFVVVRTGTDGAPALLLALAGFFFGLLLLEPVYFRAGPSEST